MVISRMRRRKIMNKYHFTISIHFKRDYDVENLGEILKLSPSSITPYEKSVGNKKSAKFVYKTNVLDDIYTDEMFEKFVKQVAPRLTALPNILNQYDGTCVFRIVFDQLKEKPCLSLSNEVLGILYNLNASYDVDFMI